MFIRSIAIYPVDSAIQRLNNWSLVFSFVVERFSDDCRKTKTIVISPTNHNRAMNQSEFLAITRTLLKAREKSRIQSGIGFSFASWSTFHMSKLIYTRLRLLRVVIGLKDSCQFFSRWEAKPKPIAPFTRDFSRASSEFQVIARNYDWFIALFAAVVIDRSNCFGFGFSTVIWKPLYYPRFDQVPAIARNSDWFIAQFVLVVIGGSITLVLVIWHWFENSTIGCRKCTVTVIKRLICFEFS